MSYGTYRQYDSRWGKKNYNGSSNYATAACGPTSCANILYEIDSSITPLTTGKYMQTHGYAIRNQGTSWNGIPACLKHFGARDVRQVDKMATIYSLLSKGYVGVFLFTAGTRGGVTWTTSGHFVAVTGYKHANGKHYFKTFDSGGRKHDGWYCYETTMKGLIRHVWLCDVRPPKVNKPKDEYSGSIPKPPLKKGSHGSGVKALQKFLNWYHSPWKLSEDGLFGSYTERCLKIFQRTEGLAGGGYYGDKSRRKAENYLKVTASKSQKKTAKKTTKEGYTGTFPTLNNNKKIINGLAHRYCYPYGTSEKKYKFSTGKPTPEYAQGINEAYPNHKNWPNKRQKAGACCDVFVGTCLAHVDIHVSKDLKNQLVDMPKMTSKLESNGHYLAKDFRLGDVVQRGRKDMSGHTWIVCELIDGTRYIANAHYKHLKGCYAVMDAKPKNIVKSKWKYYKCYTVKGAYRTYYQIHDYGYDVLYIQKFLKWAGYYNGKLDGGYGEYTKACVAKFQKAVGLKGDGCVGELTIKKMRGYKR